MAGSEDQFEEGSLEPRKRKPGRRWIMVVSAVVALGIIGASLGVYYVLYSNAPPVASFTSNSVDLRLLANAEKSMDPDDHIVQFAWDWGDHSTGTGIRAAHNYTAENSYTVTLTVTDSRGAANKTSHSVVIKVFPSAIFLARQDRMNTTFNATQSFVSTGEPITNYTWDFGDGSGGWRAVTNHTYTTPGRYTVKLTVKDNKNRTGETTRFVSPANTTVDILVDKFFTAECPFAGYWKPRTGVYGDVILQDQTSCIDFYPWVLSNKPGDLPKKNPSWIYTVYHFNAKVRNHPGYTVNDPVILPITNDSIQPLPNSYIHYDMTFDYFDRPSINALNGTIWAIDKQFNDGYGTDFRGNITMDLTMTKRIFGLPWNATPAQAQAWWNKSTIPGKSEGPAESKLDSWMFSIGSTCARCIGKYEIEAGYEWYVQNDFIDLEAKVNQTTGDTRIQIFWTGWGLDALFQRWWYWGNANYTDAVNAPYGTIKPLGWMPMEVCWCERSTYNFTIRNSLDLDYDTVQTYHFQAWGNWGADGIPATDDDLPAWVWAPYGMDYVPRAASGSVGEEGYTNSELKWWEGQQVLWGTPGSYSYGQPYEVINAPTRWILNPGSTLTVVLPRIGVPWYDPLKSKWSWSQAHKYGDYSTFNAPMTLRQICTDVDEPSSCSSGPTGDYFIWDARGRTISIAGPHDWGTDVPLQPAPWIEFAPETSG